MRSRVGRAATGGLVGIVLLTACDARGAPDGSGPGGTTAEAEGAPSGRQPAVVVSVVDGDSVWLRAAGSGPLPPGDAVSVRLLEIDAPETADCGYREAGARLAGLVPPGSAVQVERDRDLQDRFGRHLLYLWTEDGSFVNLAMIEQGFARAVLFEPNDAHIDAMRAAESAARSTRSGLWASCGSAG
ncbi:MAG TPA: thermonuclease family protein [Mycobacteriales bacterium]|nr:thermonuclease family protein [Mycobacteriales bacterium]